MNTKLKPGEVITDIKGLTERLQRKEWVYYRDKPKPPSFIMQMPLVIVLTSLERGGFREAIKNKAPVNANL